MKDNIKRLLDNRIEEYKRIIQSCNQTMDKYARSRFDGDSESTDKYRQADNARLWHSGGLFAYEDILSYLDER